jgi:predicted acyltransferase (DUF342 family)
MPIRQETPEGQGCRRDETVRAARGPDDPREPGIEETLGPEMTVVGRGAQLQGTLVSTDSIRIDGQAQGRIAARGDVILTSDSHVEADIHAQNVVTGARSSATSPREP